MDSYKEMARVFAALAHPIRLRILRLLGDGEHCVCHLIAALHKRQPYISQQLAILRDQGLVEDRRDGLMVYYRLQSPHTLDLMESAIEMLRAQGAAVDLSPVPEGPLANCSCPHCCALRGDET